MNLLNKIQRNDFLIFKILLFFIFIILIFLRLHYKTFFDDEIGSITLINNFNDIFSLYNYINNWDVSPPLSYVLFFLGKEIFTFQYAPILILPLQIYCINSFAKNSSKILIKDSETKFFYLFSIILNPIFILWCTSLRWYSLWVPFSLYIIGKLFFQNKRDEKEIFIILLILSLMFHVSYLTLIFAFCLYFSNYQKFKKEIFNFIKNNLNFSFFILIINIPQTYFFLKIHIINSSSQYGDYLLSFLYPIYTTIFGSSVFPLEIISILFCLSLLFVFYINLDLLKKSTYKKHKNLIIFFILFVLTIVLFKLGHKPRHSIILNYIFIIFLFINLSYLKRIFLKRLIISIFIIFSLLGIKNSIKEENTVKNNINLPVNKILIFLENENQNCKKKYLFTYNLNLKFYVRDKNNFILNTKDLNDYNYNCTFIVRTFIGSDNLNEVKLVNEEFNRLKSSLKIKQIRYDKFSGIKEKLFKNKIRNNFIVEILY